MKDPLIEIKNILSENELDGILISSVNNIAYLTKYFGFSNHERDAYLLVTKKNVYLFTNPLYETEIKNIAHIMPVISSSQSPFTKNIKDVYKKENIQSIGFEETNLTVSEFQKISFENISYIPVDLHKIREIKNEEQIEKIRKACILTDKAYEYIKTRVKEGISEKVVANDLELFIKKHSADISFPTIVAFGKNSAVPHHKTDNTKLKTNDIILIDFGVQLDNYCSDMTRTFFIGKPTSEQQNVYGIVLESQKKAVEFIEKELKTNDEIKTKDVDTISREYILSKEYPSIPHSLGHGIGLQVHEAPSLSPFSEDILTNGMVFSIEPGIYLANTFGVRIEDLYAIEKGKITKLTQSTT